MTSLALETAIFDSVFVEYLMSKERYTTIFRTGLRCCPATGELSQAQILPQRVRQERHGRRWGFAFKCEAGTLNGWNGRAEPAKMRT